MKNILKITIISVIMIFTLTACKMDNENNTKLTIVTTNFPSYDFIRAIVKDNDDINLKMLVSPGAETHDFEPTPKDIKDIEKSKLFIYVGGESDDWIDGILKDINTKNTKIVKLIDLVDTVYEEEKEGMEVEEEEDEEEIDEHVWTNPKNAIKIIDSLKDIMINIDESNRELYETNANTYIEELKKIDEEIRTVVASSKRKVLVFGDRFPLRYFVDEYNLDYYAAFPGCSEQTEASAKTISYLINVVKKNDIPVVFHIELSNGKIAESIAKETNAKVLEFSSIHNITQKDFDAGLRYIDIMNDNIKVLKEALN